MSRVLHAVARALASAADRLASPRRRDWVRAMTRELAEIEGAAALNWACGCLSTAIGTRIAAVKILDLIPRAVVALLILHSGAQQTLKPTMLAHGPETTPPYSRFTPWIEATPTWQVGLGFLCAALYLASAVQLLRRKTSAVILFAAAFVLDISDQAMMYAEPTFQALFPKPDVAGLLWATLYVVALGLAAAWLTYRKPRTPVRVMSAA